MVKRRTERANFYPNDPASDVPLKSVPFKIAKTESSWAVPRAPPTMAPFQPGSAGFQFGQLNLSISSCVAFWKEMFRDGFRAWHSTGTLKVIPRLDYRTYPDADDGFNAFYDRTHLGFFYDTDNIKHKTVYASESLDIISHEAGHAVLDAVQPDFWDTPLPEISAFHEAFADCSSILTTLLDKDVRKAFAKVDDPANQSNLVSKLAEEMGHGIYSRYGRDESSPESLRNAINDFNYSDPNTLPSEGPDTVLTRGNHNFARVFVGGFYQSLVGLYKVLAKDAKKNERALLKAVTSMGRILAEAVLVVAPAPTLYREMALSILKAEQHLFRGRFRQAILDSFVKKNILSGAAASSLSGSVGRHSATGSARSLSEMELPRRIGELKSQRFRRRVTEFIGIPHRQMHLSLQRGPEGLWMLRGRYPSFVKFTGTDLGPLDGAFAYLPSAFSLLATSDTELVASHVHLNDATAREEARNQLTHLANADKVYFAKPGERVDRLKLAALHKPYYLSKNKRIVRAYYAAAPTF